jgi:hypothetical protein
MPHQTPRQYAWGGSPYVNWVQRHEAENMTRPPAPLHVGPIMGSGPGRHDYRNMSVPSGAYVIPAESISHLGQSNTIAGMNVAHKLFGPNGPYGIPFAAHMATRHAMGLPRPPKMPFSEGGARGKNEGQPTPILAADGEYVVMPEIVKNIGGGSLESGHRVLDAFIRDKRKEHIATLKRLPAPAKK